MARALQLDFLLAGMRDTSGQPLNSGKVYSYAAGTSTPKDLYSNHTAASPVANPYTLDSNGRALLYGNGAYKIVIKDSDDNTLYTWDNLNFTYIQDWETWSPAFSANGSMTITSITTHVAKYRILGKQVEIKLGFSGTIGGTPSTGILFDLPIAARETNYDVGVASIWQSGQAIGYVDCTTVSAGIIVYYDVQNYAAGAVSCYVDLNYEIN